MVQSASAERDQYVYRLIRSPSGRNSDGSPNIKAVERRAPCDPDGHPRKRHDPNGLSCARSEHEAAAMLVVHYGIIALSVEKLEAIGITCGPPSPNGHINLIGVPLDNEAGASLKYAEILECEVYRLPGTK